MLFHEMEVAFDSNQHLRHLAKTRKFCVPIAAFGFPTLGARYMKAGNESRRADEFIDKHMCRGDSGIDYNLHQKS